MTDSYSTRLNWLIQSLEISLSQEIPIIIDDIAGELDSRLDNSPIASWLVERGFITGPGVLLNAIRRQEKNRVIRSLLGSVPSTTREFINLGVKYFNWTVDSRARISSPTHVIIEGRPVTRAMAESAGGEVLDYWLRHEGEFINRSHAITHLINLGQGLGIREAGNILHRSFDLWVHEQSLIAGSQPSFETLVGDQVVEVTPGPRPWTNSIEEWSWAYRDTFDNWEDWLSGDLYEHYKAWAAGPGRLPNDRHTPTSFGRVMTTGARHDSHWPWLPPRRVPKGMVYRWRRDLVLK